MKKLQMKNSLLIETPKGEGDVYSVTISELGFLMLKVYFKNGIYTTYNLGKHDSKDNIFTNKIMEYETEKN
jgi:hypothetical protein